MCLALGSIPGVCQAVPHSRCHSRCLRGRAPFQVPFPVFEGPCPIPGAIPGVCQAVPHSRCHSRCLRGRAPFQVPFPVFEGPCPIPGAIPGVCQAVPHSRCQSWCLPGRAPFQELFPVFPRVRLWHGTIRNHRYKVHPEEPHGPGSSPGQPQFQPRSAPVPAQSAPSTGPVQPHLNPSLAPVQPQCSELERFKGQILGIWVWFFMRILPVLFGGAEQRTGSPNHPKFGVYSPPPHLPSPTPTPSPKKLKPPKPENTEKSSFLTHFTKAEQRGPVPQPGPGKRLQNWIDFPQKNPKNKNKNKNQKKPKNNNNNPI
ncbi:tetra-peptide repeat homeobox protein 1-like [Serinus canaria]|uniref:tetra-peptide repeat homeobox protein 1-like n=1 Tax=Serinus canaria TaxID=9135 RepID=UPI0021CCDD72|nr:tetra-peptide repeat homeobox protein 1-like [Serinus canaria]